MNDTKKQIDNLMVAAEQMSDKGYSVGDMTNTDILKSRCDSFILGLVGTQELADKWWVSYNKAFKHTPAVQFEIDPHSVHDYLMSHCMGNFV